MASLLTALKRPLSQEEAARSAQYREELKLIQGLHSGSEQLSKLNALHDRFRAEKWGSPQGGKGNVLTGIMAKFGLFDVGLDIVKAQTEAASKGDPGAAPAPTRRSNAGATIKTGTSASSNSGRVSGRGSNSSQGAADILGGLGKNRTGINI